MTPTSAPTNYLKPMYEILDLLSGLQDSNEDKVWIRIVEKLTVALNCEAATYFLLGPKGRQLIPHYSVGVPPEELSRIPMEIGRGICGWVASHREPLLVEDAYADSRFLKEADTITGFKTRTILCVPLMDRLDLTGVIELINKRTGPFSDDDMRFVITVCRQASIALRMLRQETMLNRVTAHNASILENLTGGFLAIDVRSKVMICNPAARRILDIPGDPINQPADQALGHIPGLADLLGQTLTTKQIVKRRELTWQVNGSDRIIGYSTLLIQDPQGNLTGAGLTFQDITALIRK